METLGLYLSIPFCRAKCSFCNFASDAFAPGLLPRYLDALEHEIASARGFAAHLGADVPRTVDTVYLGGGTPSLLRPHDADRIFASLRAQFTITPDAEITVECAPGQLTPETLESLQRNDVNRLSFGIQSFVDRECAAVGRLHTVAQALAELDRVRRAGVLNLSLDLIAGLPHQTEASWQRSVEQAIDTGVPHISVYMLEIDEGSRLGREVLELGPRYGAPAVPSDDDSVTFYELACLRLEAAGVPQYEISNFARPGFRSRHNLKYWRRQPYLGLGLDAHSMLRTRSGAVRFSNPADLNAYLPEVETPFRPLPASASRAVDHLTPEQILEETIFLGLRLNDGLDLDAVDQDLAPLLPAIEEAIADGLLTRHARTLALTPRGRTLSNEAFSRLLLPAVA